MSVLEKDIRNSARPLQPALGTKQVVRQPSMYE